MLKVNHSIDEINHRIKKHGYLVQKIRQNVFHIFRLVTPSEQSSHWAYEKVFHKKKGFVDYLNKILPETSRS